MPRTLYTNFLPSADSTWSLGSTDLRWLKLWVDDITVGGNTISFGDGVAGDPRITFNSGNDGYMEWQEDEVQFHIEGGVEISTWLNVGGSFFPKAVNDGSMDATNGTEGEIVYNHADSKFYGCTVTGTPATWVAFS